MLSIFEFSLSLIMLLNCFVALFYLVFLVEECILLLGLSGIAGISMNSLTTFKALDLVGDMNFFCGVAPLLGVFECCLYFFAEVQGTGFIILGVCT